MNFYINNFKLLMLFEGLGKCTLLFNIELIYLIWIFNGYFNVSLFFSLSQKATFCGPPIVCFLYDVSNSYTPVRNLFFITF